ncbi:MAG: Bax inhibitor-1 family protein [Candidatus Korobacteraceae bacterium]|jgi:FtsH-binding integral membrane protein
MSDPNLQHGQLPPIPDGCGILPIAENRIARGSQPELLEVVPEGYAPPAVGMEPVPAVLDDAMEQTYRRVLARALAFAACALLLASLIAASMHGSPLPKGLGAGQIVVRLVFLLQVLFMSFLSRYVEKLAILPAAVLLLAYAAFCGMEFSVLLPPATLAVALLCPALMYAVTALWGYIRGSDLARPATPIFMILAGGVILAAVNFGLNTSSFTWALSSVEVVIFAGLLSYFGQTIRDFYQDFDDDNAEGWKASALGALLLLVNSVNVYLLAAAFLARDNDRESSDALPR